MEAAGIEPVNKAIENPKQDALLPAIALILLGFVIPSRPTPFRCVPARSTLEGHTEGTCDQQGKAAHGRERSAFLGLPGLTRSRGSLMVA